MSKLSIQSAAQQVEDERWKCESCEAPADERYEPYCMACGMYWHDVANGLFDELDDEFRDESGIAK
jgi:hypothetical protein